MESLLAAGLDFTTACGLFYLKLLFFMCLLFLGIGAVILSFFPDPVNTPPERVHNDNPTILEQRRRRNQ